MPRPKSCDQTRLTAARAKYRLEGDVIHSAKSIRRVRPLVSLATFPKRTGRGRLRGCWEASLRPYSRSRTTRGRHHRPAAPLAKRVQRRRRIPKNRAWSTCRRDDCDTRHIGSEFPGRPGTCWPRVFRASIRGPCRRGPAPNRSAWPVAENQLASHFGIGAVLGEGVAQPVLEPVAGRPHRRPPACWSAGSAARRRPGDWGSRGLPRSASINRARLSGEGSSRNDRASLTRGIRPVKSR